MITRAAVCMLRAGAVCCILLGGLAPAVGVASPESRALIKEGASSMSARRFEEALAKFDAAAKADPQDADAVFFRGAALNRLGRFQEALQTLERAAAMRADHPELPFETGWALLATRRYGEAIVQLERFERAQPGRGQTSEFLGRAYLGTRDYDRAEARLKEAVQRNPVLAPTVRFYLAQIEHSRGRKQAGARELESLLREHPDSPLSQRLLEELARVAPRPAALKPWRVTISASGGYNSNVIALGEGVPLPQDISSRHSAFARFTLGAAYDVVQTRENVVTLGYGLVGDFYDKVSNFNLIDQIYYVDHLHAFSGDLMSSIRVYDQISMVDGKRFRNRIGLRSALAYRVQPWLIVEPAFALAHDDYSFSTTAPLDRDGTSRTLGLNLYVNVPKTEIQFRAGYFHTRNRTDGTEFDSQGNGFFVGFSHPLFAGIVGDVSWTRMFDRYANPSAFTGGAGFAFARRDDIDVVSIQLNRALRPGLGVYLRYDYVSDDSNIAFFTFDRHVTTFGVVASF